MKAIAGRLENSGATDDPGDSDLVARIDELAERHRTTQTHRARPIGLGLKEIQHRLERTYESLDQKLSTGRSSTRADEWLLDNRHVLEETLEAATRGLPRGFLRHLPQIVPTSGDEPDYRVRVLARTLAAGSLKPVDPDRIERTVHRYQKSVTLTIAELWALPGLLRLALLELVLDETRRYLEADADRVGQEGDEEGAVTTVLAEEILSLRVLGGLDWRRSFERLSRVEQVLRRDPARAYSAMDFESRDRYRRAVEFLARSSPMSEVEIAERIVEYARSPDPADARTTHVGYYLFGGGGRRLEHEIRFRGNPSTRLLRLANRWPEGAYFGLLVPPVLICLAILGHALHSAGLGWILLVTTLLLVAVVLVEMAGVLVNTLITHLVPPRALTRLDFSRGIPAEFRTAVVVPVLFADTRDIDQVLERLEINYLNNPDRRLVYAVLSDFADAREREMPEDGRLLAHLEDGIHRLNRSHGRSSGSGPFLALQRERRWNPAEGCWMGWERKRGKLMEFNRLLAGATETSFATVIGRRRSLEGVRYVLTLDADTRVPPGAARRLVGTMAHPLSLPVIDPGRPGTLKSGYSILQPRMEIDPESTERSWFTWIFSGDARVDLYSQAVSNAYHDLFGEGIFAGKGIYDWRALEHSLKDRIPENLVLSHDLLEGAHGRTGLVSDVILMEQFPSTSASYMRRQHRWIRGDWQLLRWLMPWLTDARGRWIRNPLRLIHRWKILDNLRRSLVAPASLVLLGAAWLGGLPGPAWGWTVAVMVLLATGPVGEGESLFLRCLRAPARVVTHLAATIPELRLQTARWLLGLVLLPYQALVALDAVVRALVRQVTRRRLLQWTSAAHVQRRLEHLSSAAARWRELWVCPALGGLGVISLALLNPESLVVAGPLLAAWLAAPVFMEPVDRRQPTRIPRLDPDTQRYLRRIARRTWLFFQRFVGPDNHWLPPDNYQEVPGGRLARRTSPTNLGMALASALAAHDLGYLDTRTLAAWLRNIMERMAGLERYRGHWLNWYETRDLHALEPRYVSTVDSGNLAACLLILAAGLREIESHPPLAASLVAGIVDTLAVIAENLRAVPGLDGPGRPEAGIVAQIERICLSLEEGEEGGTCERLEQIRDEELAGLSKDLLKLAADPAVALTAETLAALRIWFEELRRQLNRAIEFRSLLMPWKPALKNLPAGWKQVPPAGWNSLVAEFDRPVVLAEMPDRLFVLAQRVGALAGGLDSGDPAGAWCRQLQADLERAGLGVAELLDELEDLAAMACRWVEEMDFAFLFDPERDLFRIGYNVTAGTLDPNAYDLLASESRLTSLIAIAKGDVPLRHWVHLDRPFRRDRGRVVLMSWSATLFEYLMPVLFMRTPPDSLMGRACRTAIRMHRDYAQRFGLPWGISESAYYQLDVHHDYQYRAFGVPGLGFRRDLGDRLVVAPYASAMALAFDPQAAVNNLRALEGHRGLGQYGFFDAVDFGRVEKRAPRRPRVVRTWMSHHQGMVLLAIDNALNDNPIQRRFHADRRISGVSMLLHERPPRTPPALKTIDQPHRGRPFAVSAAPATWPEPVGTGEPRMTLLSNGHLSVVLNAEGGGGSAWNGISVNPLRADPSTNESGQWLYVKDLDRGRWFSVTRDPGDGREEDFTVEFGPHRADFQRRSFGLLCRMSVALAAQHDLEARKLSIQNETGRPRRLLVASFAELALAPPEGFRRHPAFARLFVESRCLEPDSILLFKRRPRSHAERPVYFAQTVLASPEIGYRFGWETDRGRFLGRGRSVRNPIALQGSIEDFARSEGTVLDPAAACAVEFVLEPHGRIEIAWLNGIGHSRRELLANLRSYRSLGRVDWIFEQALLQTGQELHNLEIDPAGVDSMMRLFSAFMAPRRRWRHFFPPPAEPLQSALWARGISGDRPIVLLNVQESADPIQVETLLKAHALWAGRQIPVDLILLDHQSAGYARPGRDRLQNMVEKIRARTQRRLTGSVFVIPAADLDPTERAALESAARLVLHDARGPLERQLVPEQEGPLPRFVPTRSEHWREEPTPELPRAELAAFDNGLGGFTADGGEYIIHLAPGELPPAPWVQVLANPDFGCLVSERGTACTWAENSGELRLTPWPNDPVSDAGGEAIYLRDEETGEVWSPTPGPVSGEGAYQIRHGPGYTEFRHHGQGLEQRLSVHVDPERPVKVSVLELTNRWSWTRRLTVTSYVEWVLGGSREEEAAFVLCDFDPATGALLAQNRFNRHAGSRTAFLATADFPHGITADRTEFLGFGGSIERPEGLTRMGLSGHVLPGDDPCGALQVHIDLAPGETREVCFLLGQGRDRESALKLVRRFRSAGQARDSQSRAKDFWRGQLEVLQVTTPNPAMDLMLNRWLPYQLLACRIWGRTAYYQSSGAWGFRDQLQDVMALVWSRPEIVRDHLLRAASRQFPQGDVLHWWHEHPLRGVRTRCSDDLLWLPYVAAHYLEATGDISLLDEPVAYLEGPVLEHDEAERYAEVQPGPVTGSFYEHCCRAIEHASRVGPHGLPTIGSGDWNDGMNRVSTTGRGESVWLAWFIARTLKDFAPWCRKRSDEETGERYLALAEEMIRRAEEAGWDGAWYRRGYFDDGTPLGSAESDECQIDLIAQTWSVLASDPPTERGRQAMESALSRLVRKDQRLVLLLDPPFDLSAQDPGYIKGYPPGIRENGAQYTHAATWAVWALARLGDGDRAMELFDLLNPILRATDRETVMRYRVEPYVLAGDIYSIGANAGRGGWSWYTGAAGWLWRAGIEALLGLKLRSGALEMDPCLPGDWTGYRAELRRGEAVYRIEVTKPRGVQRGRVNITLDGRNLEGSRVPFVDDGRAHSVTVEIKA